MEYVPPLSRIVYPTLPAMLTDDDLVRHFTLTAEEEAWAYTIARHGPSMVALLTHLKVFQHLGRFLPVASLPRPAIDRIGRALSIDVPAAFDYDRRTLYRHHQAIRAYLGITPWGSKAREVAMAAIAATAEARLVAALPHLKSY